MAKSATRNAAARLRQLSCLGLAKEIAIPEMLRELHAAIPTFSNTFHFANARGDVENIYFENTDLVNYWPLYQAEVYERPREREFRGLAFSDASLRVFGVHELMSVLEADEETFHRSDYYNLVVRPVGYASNFLRLYFRLHSRVLGGITIWRSPSGAQWSAEDKRKLAGVESFFIHAITAPASDEGPLVEDGEHGLIIANAEGKPVYMSPEGRRLLFLAANPRSAHRGKASFSTALPAPVIRLCQRLARIFSDDAVDGAPIHRHANIWGGFVFRAEWLEGAGSGLVGITISHQAPMPLRLHREVAKLGLSPRQTQVCVLMASGASNEAIAERLGISPHTANEHGRWIFNKLDVHSRAELMRKVLFA